MTKQPSPKDHAGGRPPAWSPEADDAFWQAVKCLSAFVTWRSDVEGAAGQTRPKRAAAEAAAVTIAAHVRARRDWDALPFAVACARWFHDSNLRMPKALQALLIDHGTTSLAAPLARGKKRAGLVDRATWRTHASAVERGRSRGLSVVEASELAQEWGALPGPKSAATLEKHYEWWCAAQGVKPSESE